MRVPNLVPRARTRFGRRRPDSPLGALVLAKRDAASWNETATFPGSLVGGDDSFPGPSPSGKQRVAL